MSIVFVLVCSTHAYRRAGLRIESMKVTTALAAIRQGKQKEIIEQLETLTKYKDYLSEEEYEEKVQVLLHAMPNPETYDHYTRTDVLVDLEPEADIVEGSATGVDASAYDLEGSAMSGMDASALDLEGSAMSATAKDVEGSSTTDEKRSMGKKITDSGKTVVSKTGHAISSSAGAIKSAVTRKPGSSAADPPPDI